MPRKSCRSLSVTSSSNSERKVKANAARKGMLEAERLLSTAPRYFQPRPLYGSTGRGCWDFYLLVN